MNPKDDDESQRSKIARKGGERERGKRGEERAAEEEARKGE